MKKNNYSGLFIKERRIKLGLKQSELGLKQSAISQIENGTRNVSLKQAIIIAETFTSKKCNTTAQMILGILDKYVDELIQEFIKDPTCKINSVDELISDVDEEKSIEIIFKVIDELSKDLYKPRNAEYALSYIMKLTKYKLSHEMYIKRHVYLIFIYIALNDFHKVIVTYNSIKNEHMNLKYTILSKLNTANAYYYQEDYDTAMHLIKEIEELKFNQYEFEVLIAKANILTKTKKYYKSMKINRIILEKSTRLKLNNYIANSKSNMAYIFLQLGDENKSSKQIMINRACKYMNDALSMVHDVDRYYKTNIWDNAFYLELKCNNPKFKTFKMLIRVLSEIKDEKRLNDNIDNFVNYFIVNNKSESEFNSMFKILNSYKVLISSDIKLKIIKYIIKNFNAEEKKGFILDILK